jgi:methylmalonyl-CoA mutase
MRVQYGADDRSPKLKFHIQTCGRSLHAQEIALNDIRTTLQALYALFDNCKSLHTNAYDEAITTPTEESVRRALAIQLIIDKELGLSRNENPWQGSFVVEELTDLVEAAVMEEFHSLSERGGVLGAMERQYQRSKIQEESLLYESKKHTGELPIVGVNTFLSSEGSPTIVPSEVIRSGEDEKERAITNREAFQRRNAAAAPTALEELQRVALASPERRTTRLSGFIARAGTCARSGARPRCGASASRPASDPAPGCPGTPRPKGGPGSGAPAP